MKKILLIVMLCLVTLPAFAKKTTYIYTNNRFNFVRLAELDKKAAEELAITQPITIDTEQMRAILREIKLSHSFILKKEVETQDVFDESAINFLAPKLVEALAVATDKDKVEASYLTKDPIFILRNDRLTMFSVWVHEKELHFEFDKLMAHMSGDYDKRGDFSKIVANSRGLRVSLAVRDGQSYGKSTGEVVVDLNHDFMKPATETSDAEAGTPPSSTKFSETPKEEASARTDKKVIRKGEGGDNPKGPVFNKTEKVKPEDTVGEPEKPLSTKERLKQLKRLKEDGLITDEEYKAKKEEIIKGL